MCAQCVASGAVVATAGATGLRVWLAAWAPRWFTAHAKKVVSGVIVVGGVLAAGVAA